MIASEVEVKVKLNGKISKEMIDILYKLMLEKSDEYEFKPTDLVYMGKPSKTKTSEN